MEQPALLEMRDITKEFPGVKALDGVSLTVRPGTVHALMGENGAGKSTLMKCLFGIYAKNSGTIILDGKEVKSDWSDINKYEITKSGSRIAVIALGTFYQLGEKAAKLIEEKTGTAPTLINPHYITGIDKDILEDLKKNHDVVITLEDGILEGGFGEKIARFYGNSDVKTLCFGLEKKFYDRYDVNKLMRKAHLTPEQIAEDTIALLK